jgi:hypothetical protein
LSRHGALSHASLAAHHQHYMLHGREPLSNPLPLARHLFGQMRSVVARNLMIRSESRTRLHTSHPARASIQRFTMTTSSATP